MTYSPDQLRLQSTRNRRNAGLLGIIGLTMLVTMVLSLCVIFLK